MTQIDKAITEAVQGKYPEGDSDLDGHTFYIRAVDNHNLCKPEEQSYFRMCIRPARMTECSTRSAAQRPAATWDIRLH